MENPLFRNTLPSCFMGIQIVESDLIPPDMIVFASYKPPEIPFFAREIADIQVIKVEDKE